MTAGVEGGGSLVSFRTLFGSRTTTGIVPNDRLSRLTGDARLTFSPTTRFVLDAHVFGTQNKNDDAPGTGFNEGNPVSQFVRMGRQVDTDSLRKHLRDAAGNAISWNYAGQNNPFFAPLVDSNYSHRYHVGGGGSARYALTPWLDATARGGVDYVHDGRLFTIGTGWQGGFPFYASDGNFSKGGSEGDLMFSQQNSASLRFDARRALTPGSLWTIGVGTDFSNSTQRVQSFGVDSIVNVPSAGAPDTARLPGVQSWSGRSSRNSLFAETGMSFKNGASVAVTLRDEWLSMFAGQSSSSVYPSVRGALDLLRAFADSGSRHTATAAVVHAAWWRSSADVTAYDIGTMYAGRPTSGSIAPAGVGLLAADSSLSPQITSSYELGADFAFRPAHATVGVSYYHESTTGLIVPVLNSVSIPIARNAAAMSNSGVEGRASVSFGDASRGDIQWDLAATAAANSNTVDRLFGNVTTLPLGPQQLGLTVAARPGQPLGVLLGRKQLRDPRERPITAPQRLAASGFRGRRPDPGLRAASVVAGWAKRDSLPLVHPLGNGRRAIWRPGVQRDESVGQLLRNVEQYCVPPRFGVASVGHRCDHASGERPTRDDGSVLPRARCGAGAMGLQRQLLQASRVAIQRGLRAAGAILAVRDDSDVGRGAQSVHVGVRTEHRSGRCL